MGLPVQQNELRSVTVAARVQLANRPEEYLLTDLGWLVTLLFRGSILTDSGRLVFFLGVR
jgi:hypothetical protein